MGTIKTDDVPQDSFPGGMTGIVCGRTAKKQRCFYCGSIAEYQCDHPVFRNNRRKTCDTWLCDGCRHDIGKDIDLCRSHFSLWSNNGKRFVIGGEIRA